MDGGDHGTYRKSISTNIKNILPVQPRVRDIRS